MTASYSSSRYSSSSPASIESIISLIISSDSSSSSSKAICSCFKKTFLLVGIIKLSASKSIITPAAKPSRTASSEIPALAALNKEPNPASLAISMSLSTVSSISSSEYSSNISNSQRISAKLSASISSLPESTIVVITAIAATASCSFNDSLIFS